MSSHQNLINAFINLHQSYSAIGGVMLFFKHANGMLSTEHEDFTRQTSGERVLTNYIHDVMSSGSVPLSRPYFE